MAGLSITGRSGSEITFLHQLQSNIRQTDTSLERLSTGKRINAARDDPTGLIQAELLRGEITDFSAEIDALGHSGRSIKVREAALSNVQNLLNDVRGLILFAAGDTASDNEKAAAQVQIDAAIDAIQSVGQEHADVASLTELRSGGAANVIDGDLAQAETIVDGVTREVALDRVADGAALRYDVKATQRLYQDLEVIHIAALSQIEDTDFAAEAANLAGSRVLTEAAILALSYSKAQRLDQIQILLEGLDLSSDS